MSPARAPYLGHHRSPPTHCRHERQPLGGCRNPLLPSIPLSRMANKAPTTLGRVRKSTSRKGATHVHELCPLYASSLSVLDYHTSSVHFRPKTMNGTNMSLRAITYCLRKVWLPTQHDSGPTPSWPAPTLKPTPLPVLAS